MTDEASICQHSATTSSSPRCTTTSTTAWPTRSSRARTSCWSRGWSAERVLNDALVEGMRIVGIDFRDGILFVPEVLLAANAMKAGMEILRPLLAETGVERIGKIVIGTVKGDIHDIGKNLVAMMLEGAGFEVIDLGINNPVEKYLAALEEHKPDILGMSALLTTTMPYMKVVIDTLKEKGIRDDYIVLVGGAPLNEEFGKAVGADAYCRDAAVASETAQALVLARRAQPPHCLTTRCAFEAAARRPADAARPRVRRDRARGARRDPPQRLDARRRSVPPRASCTTRRERSPARWTRSSDASVAGRYERDLRGLRRLRHGGRARRRARPRTASSGSPGPTATGSSRASTRSPRCTRTSRPRST